MQNELDFLETLFTPLVSDVMDSLGITGQVLPHTIQSIFPDPHLKVTGYAFGCRVVPTEEYVEIHKLLEMVDAIEKDSFVLVASDSPIDAALWGGLMSTRAKVRGARGAAVTGGVRDIEQIEGLGFPVFAEYKCVRDIRRRGYMAEYNTTITIGDTRISPKDIVFADANGIVVIPSSKKEEVLHALAVRIKGEEGTSAGLLSGKSAKELFGEFETF